MNYFNTTHTLIAQASLDQLGLILEEIKIGMNQTNQRLQDLHLALAKKKDYLTVQTPVQWAQSLYHVFVEVRYAHRHDAPGCSKSMEEHVEIGEDFIELQVLCIERVSKIKYLTKIQLWGKINVTESKHEYQAVGKHHFTLLKQNAPTRWRHLYGGGSENKPLNYRLWLAQHEKFVNSLWEFEGDSIEDYEGHQWMEEEEESYREYQHRKNLPKKGPIPVEKKKKSKKNKKNKKSVGKE